VGLLAVAGFAVADSFVDEPVVEEVKTIASCGGGCSAGNTCGNLECGAKVSGSCGCGRS